MRGFGEKRGLKKHMLSAHGRPWTAEDDTTEIPKKPLYQPTASNETSEIKSELEWSEPFTELYYISIHCEFQIEFFF